MYEIIEQMRKTNEWKYWRNEAFEGYSFHPCEDGIIWCNFDEREGLIAIGAFPMFKIIDKHREESGGRICLHDGDDLVISRDFGSYIEARDWLIKNLPSVISREWLDSNHFESW